MSQEKAQLIAPIENITVTGVVATGVITATSFVGNVTGSASSIVQGANVVAGIVTAGLNTTTAFSGNLTGNAGGLSGDPDIHVGVLTATSFVGNVVGLVTGRATGLSNTGAGTSNLNIGTFTATTFYGDGSNLSGVAGAAFSQQSIGITSATTSIDLSNGNVVHANQSSDTTVSFANTAGSNEIYFVREKDATNTARSITWPDTIKWDGGTAPTLISANDSGEAQVFKLTTTTNGETWYGKEVYRNLGGYRMFVMGLNYDGSLGLNVGAPFPSTTQGSRSSPTQLSGAWNTILKPSSSSFGGRYGIKTNGTLWSWGNNGFGQLGHDNITDISSPVQVGTKDNWVTGSSLNSAVIVYNTDGELWSWGYNGNGALGHNNAHPVNYSSPTQIPGTWGSVIGAGDRQVFNIKTNGTLWGWGMGYLGELGLNEPVGGPGYGINYSSPIQIGTEDTWAQVGGGGYWSWGTKTDGTLWTWGDSNYGLLGLNQAQTPTFLGISSPTQVPGTNWGITANTVSQGTINAYCVKQDGTLWTWGNNSLGSLGLNQAPAQILNISSPTQIPGTNWASVHSMAGSGFATKTDGTAWVWGGNGHGQLGQNTSTITGALSSPTQIPGVGWQGVMGGGDAYGTQLLKS